MQNYRVVRNLELLTMIVLSRIILAIDNHRNSNTAYNVSIYVCIAVDNLIVMRFKSSIDGIIFAQDKFESQKRTQQEDYRIVIVNSRFLQRQQKRSRGNQLILRCLSKTKSIAGQIQRVRQADRQSDGYGGWCLELRRGGWL